MKPRNLQEASGKPSDRIFREVSDGRPTRTKQLASGLGYRAFAHSSAVPVLSEGPLGHASPSSRIVFLQKADHAILAFTRTCGIRLGQLALYGRLQAPAQTDRAQRAGNETHLMSNASRLIDANSAFFWTLGDRPRRTRIGT